MSDVQLLCGRATSSTQWKGEDVSPTSSAVTFSSIIVTSWSEHQLVSLFNRVSENQLSVLNLLLDCSASLILLLWIGLLFLRLAQEAKLVPRVKLPYV